MSHAWVWFAFGRMTEYAGGGYVRPSPVRNDEIGIDLSSSTVCTFSPQPEPSHLNGRPGTSPKSSWLSTSRLKGVLRTPWHTRSWSLKLGRPVQSKRFVRSCAMRTPPTLRVSKYTKPGVFGCGSPSSELPVYRKSKKGPSSHW